MKIKKPVFMMLFFIPLVFLAFSGNVVAQNSSLPDNVAENVGNQVEDAVNGSANSNQDQEESQETNRAIFDGSTRIKSVNWSTENVTIVFESDIPRSASLTDLGSIDYTGGTSEVEFKTVTLGVGRTEVVMSAEMGSRGKAVSVVVGDSMLVLTKEGSQFLPEPEEKHVVIGSLSGGVTVLLVSLGVVWIKNRRVSESGRRVI